MIPRLLRSDNLTPPTRTPWGGEEILGHYKADLDLHRTGKVGESWEVSVEPSFPSLLAGTETLLSDAIAADPVGWLGPEVAARYGGQTPLLIKLLDAADNLSVQVHPRDGDPELALDESGKPEAWIVLRARPGAGLYLGFQDGVAREDVVRCLERSGPLDRLMNFVTVSPGDAFVIAAGTPHAIGGGVTLIEPQFVTPGRRGVTYRFWDWNRRYDAEGQRDPSGAPRPLHVARSLAVTRWGGPTGEAFVSRCRALPRLLQAGPLVRQRVVSWPWFVSERWRGSGTLTLPPLGTMWALTAFQGRAELETAGGVLTLRRGQSAVVPASAGALEVRAEELDLIATYSPLKAPA
uniref:Phosphomannose isomerase n=2 Tax=environmental samples TaxID=48479 RepID=C7FPK0_9BACT|nr:phosphomannose isomerase [uncultured bacterium HF186_25m_18N5]ACU26503.1 phosphomannose isomerase [uncultured bacterium HF186_25m_27D22]